MFNSFDSDHFVRLGLVTSCLQRLSADDTDSLIVKTYKIVRTERELLLCCVVCPCFLSFVVIFCCFIFVALPLCKDITIFTQIRLLSVKHTIILRTV